MSRHPRRYLSPVSSIPMSAVHYYLQDEAEFLDGEMGTHFAWEDGLGGQGAAPSELQDNMLGGTAPHVTELYRRKTEENYVIPQEVVMADEPRYYYRPAALARLPQRRLPVGVTPSSAAMAGVAMAMQHPQPYYPPPLEEPHLEQYDSMYGSQQQLHRMMEGRPILQNTAGVVRRTPSQVNNMSRKARPAVKPPVSVRTPRFIRRNLYKRPSTLCLQLPHTTDPNSRPLKSRFPTTLPLSVPPLALRREHSTSTTAYHTTQAQTNTAQTRQNVFERARINTLIDRKMELMDRRYKEDEMRAMLTTRSAPATTDETVKEEELDRVQRLILERRGISHEYGDDCTSEHLDSPDRDPPTDSKCSELELLLNQYEQIFSNTGPEISLSTPKARATTSASRRSSQKSRAKRKASIGKLAGLMKPRLPPSLKAVQKQVSNPKNPLKRNSSSSAEEDRQEIEQMTAEVLDNLLQELSMGGLAGEAVKVSSSSCPSSEIHKNKTDKAGSVKSGKKKEFSRKTSRRCSRKVSRQCSRKPSRKVSRNASRNHSRKGSLNSSGKASLSESRNDSIAGSIRSKKGSRKGSRKCSRRSSRHRVSSAKPKIEDCHETDKKSSKVSVKKSQTNYPEVKSYRESSKHVETTFIQDRENFKDYNNSSRTSFIHEKTNCDQFSRDVPPYPADEHKERRQYNREEESARENAKKTSWTTKDKKFEDHTAALELHRSKSYIVNLIDRALSRELGTIPEERASKQYLNLDARTAMDLIASKNMDNDMCVEITQAIAESFPSNNNKDTRPTSANGNRNGNKPSVNRQPCCSKTVESSREERGASRDDELIFSSGGDEPLYIKQLKKLRWGHLKHIQREMRRLEDLERFLDSCSSDK